MPKAASIQELLQSGAHFGHLTRRWNLDERIHLYATTESHHRLKKTQNYLQEAIDEIQSYLVQEKLSYSLAQRNNLLKLFVMKR